MRSLGDHEADQGPRSLAGPTTVTLTVDIKHQEVVTGLGGGLHIETDLVVAGEVVVESHHGLAEVTHGRGVGAILAFVSSVRGDLPAAVAAKLPVVLAEITRLEILHLAIDIHIVGIPDEIMSRVGDQNEFVSRGGPHAIDVEGEVNRKGAVNSQIANIEDVLVEADLRSGAIHPENGVGCHTMPGVLASQMQQDGLA